jgi:hypothetical protein
MASHFSFSWCRTYCSTVSKRLLLTPTNVQIFDYSITIHRQVPIWNEALTSYTEYTFSSLVLDHDLVKVMTEFRSINLLCENGLSYYQCKPFLLSATDGEGKVAQGRDATAMAMNFSSTEENLARPCASVWMV